MHYVTNGTIRFPSAHAITLELHKQFPEANIVIAENGSIDRYKSLMLHEEYYILFDELSKKNQDEIIKFFSGNNFERYNDTAKRHYFLCQIFREEKEEQFVSIAQKFLKNETIDNLKKLENGKRTTD